MGGGVRTGAGTRDGPGVVSAIMSSVLPLPLLCTRVLDIRPSFLLPDVFFFSLKILFIYFY